MNVIVSNKYTQMLSDLDIEVIKRLEGVYPVEEIISTFQNFFFERMILDITAIQGYEDIKNLQRLSISLDTTKIILILDDNNEVEMNSFLSQIISMGIYNFTRNVEGIKYLLQNPNSYRDVAHIHNLSAGTTRQDVYMQGEGGTIIHKGTKVIGIKNVTEHSGATTLVHVMKRELSQNYTCVAIEVDKMDFLYFGDKEMISSSKNGLATELMKHRDKDVVLVDLNDYPDVDVCNEVLYLMQPGILKLNKMVKRNKRISESLKDRKVVLNQSLLDKTDIDNLAYDLKINFYASIPPIDDRSEINVPINNLLAKLGFGRQADEASNEQAKLDGQGNILGFLKK